MKTLLIYPFLGELGHELFSWQSYLRKLSYQYDQIKVVCKKHHNFLYEDFATVFENYNHPDAEYWTDEKILKKWQEVQEI